MRLSPVALFCFPSVEDVLRFSAQSLRTTHGAPEAVEFCQMLGFVLARWLSGMVKDDVLDASSLSLTEPSLKAVAVGDFRAKLRDEIRRTGYAVASLEAALWCFYMTQSFEAAVLEAENLGDDADTTAAIVGQVVGTFFTVLGMVSPLVSTAI